MSLPPPKNPPPAPPLLPPSPGVPPFAPVSAGQAVVQVQATVITLNLQIAGDVNDFGQGSSARANLEANFRSRLECYDPCQFRLLISSASVNIQAQITVPNPPAGTAPSAPTANLAATVLAAAAALTSQPAAALSAALAVTVTQAPTITVAENVAVPMIVAPPPPSSPSGSALDDVLSNLGSIQKGTSTQTVIIIVVAVVALVCALALAFYFCWVRPGYKSRVHFTVAPSAQVINTPTKDKSNGPGETELMSSGGMSWERGSGGAGERGSSEDSATSSNSPLSFVMGATAHAEGSMGMGSALQDKPVGYHVRTAWT